MADAHGLAGKTLLVAVVALEGVLSVGGVGEGRSDEEAEEADSKELEVHDEDEDEDEDDDNRVGLVVGWLIVVVEGDWKYGLRVEEGRRKLRAASVLYTVSV
jgi:hypothetical protein